MTSRPLPNPQRLRQIPAQFSWIDHRLVREGYFEQCSCDALALYLFLLTVADARGLSYYSQPLLMKHLKFGTVRFMQARSELIEIRLIAYRHPLYQVLALDVGATQKPALAMTCNVKSASAPRAIKALRQTLRCQEHS